MTLIGVLALTNLPSMVVSFKKCTWVVAGAGGLYRSASYMTCPKYVNPYTDSKFTPSSPIFSSYSALTRAKESGSVAKCDRIV